MKRCPECGREYDNTMMFCLDDGAELLYGPAVSVPPASAGGQFGDEPQTAILSVPPAAVAGSGNTCTSFVPEPGDLTQPTDETDVKTAILETPATASGSDSVRRSAKPLIAAVVAVVVFVGGFFGYRYLSSAGGGQINSIAVMPFVNDSGNADVEYLSDGMTETLIKGLSQVPNLAVKSRSTVFYYKGKDISPKQIGEQLGVQAVVLGRVSGRGDDLRLSLELVNTQSQDVIWTEQYNRKQSDLVSLQSEIAKDVSARLKLKLSGAEEAKVTKTSTIDPEAYQAYLKGRYFWNRRTADSLKKAIEQFKSATDRDPNYAMAYVGLAEVYVVLNEYSGVPLTETLPLAKQYAERAISLDGQLAEPHAALGGIHEYQWNWPEAEQEYKRAVELNPSYATAFHWYGNFLRGVGRSDEGFLMLKRAYELDPLSSIILNNLAGAYQEINDDRACIEHSLKLIELEPSFSSGYSTLGISYLKIGRTAEGIANLEKAVELSNREGGKLGYLGYGYGLTGRRAEAIAMIKELEEKYKKNEAIPKNIAAVYAGLDDKDRAFEWLEIGFQTKSDILYLKWEAPYEPLRDDPRFRDLLKRMGLPE